MCKYCEEIEFEARSGLIKFARNGGANIRFDPEDVGFLLEVASGLTYAVEYCPWCGRKLELPEDEPDFSAEDEIARLDGRINHTNKMLRQLLDNVQAVASSNNYDLRTQVIRNLENMKGKI